MPAPLLYLSAYFVAHRQSCYELLLAVSQRGAWDEWLRFFLRGIFVQAQDAVTRARQLQDLRESYREQSQAARAHARLLQAVDLLFAYPVLTVRQLATGLGVYSPVAQRTMNQVREAGLLQEITGKARNRGYRAEAILWASEEPVELYQR